MRIVPGYTQLHITAVVVLLFFHLPSYFTSYFCSIQFNGIHSRIKNKQQQQTTIRCRQQTTADDDKGDRFLQMLVRMLRLLF